jgi:hypothetical protein
MLSDTFRDIYFHSLISIVLFRLPSYDVSSNSAVYHQIASYWSAYFNVASPWAFDINYCTWFTA